MRELWRRLSFLFRRQRLDAELQEELRYHLEMTAREYEQSGLSVEESQYAARRQFGSTLRAREASREFWGWRWIDDLAADATIALRMLARRRSLTLTAIASLALGIGGAVTIVTVIYSVLLRPLPYRDPDRLVTVWATSPDSHVGAAEEMPPLSDYVAWRERNSFFGEMGALLLKSEVNLTGDGPPEWLMAQKATSNLFPLLGVEPVIGRRFLASDEAAGAAPVVVLSHGVWRSRYAADVNVLTRTVAIDGVPHRIIGIMPEGFGLPDDKTALWMPFDLSPAAVRDSSDHVRVITRLNPGISLDAARERMTALAVESAPPDWPGRQKLRGGVTPLRELLVGPVRESLMPLVGAVGFLLLIAFANMAGLLMALEAERSSECAVRSALGAGRGRLVRQRLTESMLLTLAGCAAGLVLGSWLVEPLIALSPAGLPRRNEIRLDQTVVLFSVAMCLLSGGVFGIFPALASSKADPARSLQRAGVRTTGGIGRQRVRRLLVTAQIAVALTLCTGAALMMRSLHRLLSVEVGFDPRQVMTFQVRLSEREYSSEITDGSRGAGWSRVSARAPARYQEIIEKLRQIPGVESASAISWLPLNGYYYEGRLFTIVRRPDPAPGENRPGAGYNPVDVDYFRTMRAPLVRGRLFNRQDDANSPWVAIINETLARTWWPNQDPVGQYVSYKDWGDPRPRQIVGVVRDARQDRLRAMPRGHIYFPFAQLPPENHTNRLRTRLHMCFVVRSTADPESMTQLLRSAVHEVDKDIPVFATYPMDYFLASSAADTRFLTVLLGSFAVLSVLLAAVGLYGIMSYSVAQRTQEIGIRIALGAQRAGMARMVLRQAFEIGLAGTAAGVCLSLALTRYLTSVLFGIRPTDPVTYLAVCGFLCAVALFASYVPARWAAGVDPATALRCE